MPSCGCDSAPPPCAGTMLAVAVANVVVYVFEVIVYALVVGVLEAIFSAFTRGRVRINHPPPPPRLHVPMPCESVPSLPPPPPPLLSD